VIGQIRQQAAPRRIAGRVEQTPQENQQHQVRESEPNRVVEERDEHDRGAAGEVGDDAHTAGA
jgi:hypothetical protein